MGVLVAYDGSAPAQKALKHAATYYPDEEITLLRIAEASDGSIEAGLDLIQEKLKELREETTKEVSAEVSELIRRDDIDFQMEVVAGKPAREIVSFAETNDIDTVIVGNHGRKGVSRVLLGSVAEQVVRTAPATVTVVR